jgi:hypothetical protein
MALLLVEPMAVSNDEEIRSLRGSMVMNEPWAWAERWCAGLFCKQTLAEFDTPSVHAKGPDSQDQEPGLAGRAGWARWAATWPWSPFAVWGLSSSGRAPCSQRGGKGFEALRFHNAAGTLVPVAGALGVTS